ncbi:MAG: tetrahydromethanopterin S-methyltransferase subunit C [Clostridia bacterium]|jgi:tetrahydromethanopterin S-methyltransferase subunit C
MTVKIDPTQINHGIPHTKIMIAGIASTLVFLYCTFLNSLTGSDWFSFFGGLAAIAALVWGSDTIKILNSYGLATGVPSAGMIGFGAGAGAMLISTLFGFAAPLVALLVAGITGLIVGYLANSVLNMKIPVMIQSLTELAIVGALTQLGLMAMITGGYSFSSLVGSRANQFLSGGIIFVVFILGAIALQHPWNAVLPSGKQDRMLMLGAECGFLTMMMAAILSFAFISTAAAGISLVIAVAGWGYAYYRYFALCRRDAAAWLDAKPIPEIKKA